MKPLVPVPALVFALCAISLGLSAQPAAPPADGMVVVISLDGFPAKALTGAAAPIPTLRRLAAGGAIAAGMMVTNPAVTWPSHTSMVTGVAPARHGVLFNGLLERPSPRAPVRIEPWRDKREMVHAPTVYDLAYQSGLTTAQVDWVAIQNPGTINWAFPERPSVSGAVEREMIAAGLVTEEEVANFAGTIITRRDQIWTDAALHILRTHKPRLMLMHLLTLDSVQHSYGPGSLAASSAMAFLDGQVKRVLDGLESAGLRERTTVIVVSDHGFKVAPKVVRPNVMLRDAGLLQGSGTAVVCDAFAVSEGGTAMVYVTDPGRRAELRERLQALFRGVEGIAEVVDRTGFARLGMPDPDRSTQMADLVLVAADGYGFGAETDGATGGALPNANTGRHGYVNSDPEMNAIFIASGRGIKPGARVGTFANVDIAPTIASLLGLRMPNIDGRTVAGVLVPAR